MCFRTSLHEGNSEKEKRNLGQGRHSPGGEGKDMTRGERGDKLERMKDREDGAGQDRAQAIIERLQDPETTPEMKDEICSKLESKVAKMEEQLEEMEAALDSDPDTAGDNDMEGYIQGKIDEMAGIIAASCV